MTKLDANSVSKYYVLFPRQSMLIKPSTATSFSLVAGVVCGKTS